MMRRIRLILGSLAFVYLAIAAVQFARMVVSGRISALIEAFGPSPAIAGALLPIVLGSAFAYYLLRGLVGPGATDPIIWPTRREIREWVNGVPARSIAVWAKLRATVSQIPARIHHAYSRIRRVLKRGPAVPWGLLGLSMLILVLAITIPGVIKWRRWNHHFNTMALMFQDGDQQRAQRYRKVASAPWIADDREWSEFRYFENFILPFEPQAVAGPQIKLVPAGSEIKSQTSHDHVSSQ
jgi:hypothetical protein